jgi:hypothetical protein
MASPLKPFQEFMLTIIQGRRSELHENGLRRGGSVGEGAQRHCKKKSLIASNAAWLRRHSIEFPPSLFLLPEGRLELCILGADAGQYFLSKL